MLSQKKGKEIQLTAGTKNQFETQNVHFNCHPFVTIIKVLLLFLRVTLLNDKFVVICKYNHTNTIGNYKNVHYS